MEADVEKAQKETLFAGILLQLSTVQEGGKPLVAAGIIQKLVNNPSETSLQYLEQIKTRSLKELDITNHESK